MLVAAPVEQVPSLLKRSGHSPEHGPRALVSGRVETKDLRGKLVSPGAGVWMVDLVGDVEGKLSVQAARALEAEALKAEGRGGLIRR
jgi:hypothetical protein